ncbi:hypothetical protein N0O92_13180 [Alkalihalobacillus sp. MEB130]|uniref:hypothetical protein n=1 Tax=Alkalihalobacillus sp. MEB130 TaxID=2976704 RepID=UPI0028DF5795|nr:hypothetical protein [Alkalihalobacillus sp. MEB130]MDT8861188.1 hypothetical protein [Alkalihalobacillus sp. MEB130]
MLQIVFIWAVLIGTFFLNKKALEKDKKVRNLYLVSSCFTALLAVFLDYEIGLNKYTEMLIDIFGSFTDVVIGR